jgi:hypothetical protein
MTPDALGVIKANLGRFEAEIFAEARREGRRESHQAYLADALVALAQASSGTRVDPGGKENPGGTKRSRPTFDPKALVRLRVDLAAFLRGHTEPGETCSIPGVGSVPVASARALLGEAILELVITRGTDVVTVVSDTRYIAKALAIALEERDPTCCVPRCDKSDPLERDHWRVDFGKDGPTSIDNLARLCSFHHHLKTYRGWKLEGGPGQWRFTKPDPPPRADPEWEVTDTGETKEARRRAAPANDPPTQEPLL